MYCPHCTWYLPSGARYCPGCGNPVRASAKAMTALRHAGGAGVAATKKAVHAVEPVARGAFRITGKALSTLGSYAEAAAQGLDTPRPAQSAAPLPRPAPQPPSTRTAPIVRRRVLPQTRPVNRLRARQEKPPRRRSTRLSLDAGHRRRRA